MLRVYFLFVDQVGDVETVRGTDIMHDAILLATWDKDKRQLIMDTSDAEHLALATLAISWRNPLPQEIDLFNSIIFSLPPSTDTIRAEEILSLSPPVITMPEMWELLRIFGKHLGYTFN